LFNLTLPDQQNDRGAILGRILICLDQNLTIFKVGPILLCFQLNVV